MAETVVKLSDRELAAVLAALRLAQQDYIRFARMDHFRYDGLKPLNTGEIDGLCERINFGEDHDPA